MSSTSTKVVYYWRDWEIWCGDEKQSYICEVSFRFVLCGTKNWMKGFQIQNSLARKENSTGTRDGNT